jgi:DNA-binding MarR family transcriptional regulator
VQASTTEREAKAPGAEAADHADQLARDVGLFLRRVLTSNNREFFAALQEAGISFTQLKCLGLLSEAVAPMSLGALSEELVLSPAAVSRAVDGLVQRGALKRDEDPSDRRSKIVSLSARGRAAYERVMAVRLAGVRRFVEELEPQERDALGAALHPIVERLSV